MYALKWKFGQNKYLALRPEVNGWPAGTYVSDKPTLFKTKAEAILWRRDWCRGTWTLIKISD